MKRIHVMAVTSMVLVIVATLFVFQTSKAKAAIQLTCGTWKAVTSPNEGDGAELVGVTALASNNVWSVGDFDADNYRHTLIEHWNGKSWQIVSSPDGQTILNQLTAVAAVSANNIWAVGHYRANLSSDSTLIEHWDGTQWSIVSSPNTSSPINFLNAVAVMSASDIWAVGSRVSFTKNGNPVFHDLTEHWDGVKWSVVPGADPGKEGNELGGVTAIASNDVWAVGSHTAKNGTQQPLIEQWNGSTWTAVSSPQAGINTSLQNVSALSANAIWAVGMQSNSTGSQTLVEYWNGTQWSIVTGANTKQLNNGLFAVAAITPHNVWASGLFGKNPGRGKALIEHWNGTQWSIVASPSPGHYNNVLEAIAAIPQTQQVWMSGIYQTSIQDVGHTLIETNC